VCPGCCKEIDPTTCGCGGSREFHGSPMDEGHYFIPMGCDCYRDKTPIEPPVSELTETTDLPWDL
jgi:hypothetical protein